MQFVGSEAAAQNLASSEEFQRARVVKVHPSLNANAFRECCYAAGKTVLVPPLPGHDFLYIRVEGSEVPPHQRSFASTKNGFRKYGTPITSLLDVPAVDLVVVASTAVCVATGARLGKGAGYGEVEWGILADMGLVSEETPVATLVHEVQLVPESLLPSSCLAAHDLRVDLAATPRQLLRCGSGAAKPAGIDWPLITPQMAVDIGALRQLRCVKGLPDLPPAPREAHGRGRGRGGGRGGGRGSKDTSAMTQRDDTDKRGRHRPSDDVQAMPACGKSALGCIGPHNLANRLDSVEPTTLSGRSPSSTGERTQASTCSDEHRGRACVRA